MRDIFKLLIAADELHLQELVDYLQPYLIENKADWIEQNFELTHQTSFHSNNFLELQRFCTNFMTNYPEKIFESLDFTSIPEKSLVLLIKREDIKMKEIEIWKCVLEWGVAQNSTLDSDPATWTDDDFKKMENTLQNCLPLIRFGSLSSKEFLEKVHPYKRLLKPQFYEDLLKYYLDPESKPSNNLLPSRKLVNLDSKITNINIISLISKYIDKMDLSNEKELYLPYEFKLLLRGSRDGFTPKIFHSLCDFKPKTITFVKVKGTDEILGGYNPLTWNRPVNGGWVKCKDSFIFSFKINNNKFFNDVIFSNVKRTDCALDCSRSCGPTFGDDLTLLYRGSHSYRQRFYGKKIRDTEGYFLIEDYEVFQVLKK